MDDAAEKTLKLSPEEIGVVLDPIEVFFDNASAMATRAEQLAKSDVRRIAWEAIATAARRLRLEVGAWRLQILRSAIVQFERGYSGSAPSQVSEVALLGRGMTGWAREWRRASSMESFTLSSGARLGHKVDGNRIGVEVLELAVEVRSHWQPLAEAIGALDTLGRPVVRNRQWTAAKAREALDGVDSSSGKEHP